MGLHHIFFPDPVSSFLIQSPDRIFIKIDETRGPNRLRDLVSAHPATPSNNLGDLDQRRGSHLARLPLVARCQPPEFGEDGIGFDATAVHFERFR